MKPLIILGCGYVGTRIADKVLAGQPVEAVVQSLTRPSGAAVLHGPAPTDDEGNALSPADSWGQDHCWWLDRMVRSDQQLVERMTFIWHDWFANSNEKVNSQQRMLDQNNLFRANALGNFHDLFMAVTTDPAMLVFLDGIYNDKWEPNENYAREMMELFSLGADRGAYSEDDIREQARALTGWRYDWSNELGAYNFRFDPKRHDTGTKTVAYVERMPGMFVAKEWVEVGGLMSYGESLSDMYQRGAYFVEKIFKGTKPADLPVE